MPKAKKATFSRVKAAKARARATVGTPPPERVVPNTARKQKEQPRYRKTLADLLPQGRGHEEST